jgi:hypothetical protein
MTSYLVFFAAFTDESPPEVAAAGHERCIIPIKPGNIDAWLMPDASNLASLYAILDDRARAYYDYRMATRLSARTSTTASVAE